MRQLSFILLLIVTLSSCGSARNRRTAKTKKHRTIKPVISKTETVEAETKYETSTVNAIIKHAKKYKGTRYKYGGNTKKGIDCSGLIHNAFKEENINIPRVSSSMATTGNWIDLKTVQKGDLLFFATKKNSRNINHVGLVTKTDGDHVEFIHATSSKGVITSNLKQKYWYFAFVQARRIL